MNKYKEIAEKIKDADAILIGASNGLSIAEGLHLFADNQEFQKIFGDFQKKYGIRNILGGYFYNWDTPEEKWGFLSRLVEHYSGRYATTPVMENLVKIVGDRPYFIVTSNGEGHFEMAGFAADKVYEVEGNWIEMRCSHKCHKDVYPAIEVIRNMAAAEKEGKVPPEIIPRCPRCGAVRALYDAQPPKEGIEEAWRNFLKEYHGKNLVILELGIGWRNQLIKAPLMELTAQEPKATYITVNLGEVYIKDNIKEKSFGLDGDLDVILRDIAKEF